MTMWGERLGVFDLETTGVDVDTSRIVSACIAVLDEDGVVVSRWNWLADPGIDIPEGASAVHGITTERAQHEGRPATVVIAEIVQTLRVLFASSIPVAIYNAPYDLTLLDRECRRHGLEPLESAVPVVDPLVIDKAVDRYRKGKRTLEMTAELYDVPLDEAHDAGADAVAAGRVALALLRRYPDDLDISLADLHGRQEVWHAEQAASFQEYLRAKRGDDSYVADPSWPVKLTDDVISFVDTQPIPPLPPRPSGNVPVLDFSATGVLALETARGETTRGETTRDVDEPSARRFDSEAYRRAPRPQLGDRVQEWEQGSLESGEHDGLGTDGDPFLESDDDEPAWIIEPSSVPSVSVAETLSSDPQSTDSVSSDSLTVGELVESFPVRERDLPDIDDTQVVDSVEFELEVDGDLELVEPVSATDAVGEPESDPQPDEDPGPPQAVMRIAAAIITDPEGRCLLVRKAGTNTFMQAGGKLEPGESAVDALARELQEELGLELDESTAEYLGVFRADAANEPHALVSAAVFAFETAAEVSAQGEIEELLWIEGLDGINVELAPLTRDELLPLWASRRAGSTLL